MKNFAYYALVGLLLYFISVLLDIRKAEKRNLKFVIHEGGLISSSYYTNSYKIDSSGCVTFKNDMSSKPDTVIICGSFTIKKFKPK